MLDFIKKLQELEEKILSEFDEFKNFYRLMYKNDPKNLDNLIFKVKYQLDQIRNDLFRYQEEEFNKVRY